MENVLRIVLIEKLRADVLQLEQLLQTFKDRYGDLEEVNIQIASMQREIDELIDACNNSVHRACINIIGDENQQ